MTFKPQHSPEDLYFVIGSLLSWRPLFMRPEYAQLMLNSLDWHRCQQRLALFAYVIMPTHFHALIKPAGEQTISSNLQSLGSFTAHAILKQLRADHLRDELHLFAEHRQTDRTEKHQVWQPLQAKNIYGRDFLIEKMEYINNNPIARYWALVRDRADYLYSSARFYDRGEAPLVDIDDVREWL